MRVTRILPSSPTGFESFSGAGTQAEALLVYASLRLARALAVIS